RIEQRGDEYVKTSMIPKILNRYEVVMSKAVVRGITVYTYDTGILSSDEIHKQILKLPEVQRLIDSSDIFCKRCTTIYKKENSFFNGEYCWTCYSDIIKELFYSNE